MAAGRRTTGAGRPAKTRTVCLSHMEDADGISAAAVIRQAFGGETVLTDYPGQISALEAIAADPALKSLYVCDLGLNKKNQGEFAGILEGLRRRRVSVTYIDHHDAPAAVLRRLSAAGVRLVHDTSECATVLAYRRFRAKLPDHAAFIAACAAITDYMDGSPEGARLLQMFDRQFAFISATVLTYNIVGRQKDMGRLLRLVGDLAASKYPHDLPGSFAFAQEQAGRLGGIIAEVKKGMTVSSNMAHMEVRGMGAAGVVNFVMGLSGKKVGMAYKERAGHGVYAVSVRGSPSCRAHLGRLMNRVAAEHGGSGGGHKRACGAIVPREGMRAFIRAFNRGAAKA